jgi:hypothetical protein
MGATVSRRYLRRVGTYYRMQRPEDDPERLLDPDEQYTEPWGDTHRVRDGVSVFPVLDALYPTKIVRVDPVDRDRLQELLR